MRNFASPIVVISDELFSVGIFLQMKFLPNDSLESYYIQEKLINLVDECERLLTQSVNHIYNPNDISLSMLHSIQFFLQECIRKKISTYKASILFPQIEAKYIQLVNKPSHHDFIYHFFNDDSQKPSICPMDNIAYFNFMGEIGFYSLLYGRVKLFRQVLDNILSQYPNFLQTASHLVSYGDVSLTTLLGWGYGLLHEENSTNINTQILLRQNKWNNYTIEKIVAAKKYDEKQLDEKDDLIDMSLLTFCIPVRIDSVYRLKNLISLLSFYSHCIRTNYLILEADSKQQVKSLPSINGLHYMFVEDANPIFHRTHYINQMLRAVTTPLAAVWDTDVIAPIAQLHQAYNHLLNNQDIMVYPYDGCFWQVNYAFTKLFYEKKQIAIFQSNYMPRIYMAGYHSVGGAFLVNIKDYWVYGGENEHFAGWGPEDVERYHRLEILGKRPIRIAGPLYHLYHTRGINSGDFDQNLAVSTKREYIRICAMVPNELRTYIQTWTWINETKR